MFLLGGFLRGAGWGCGLLLCYYNSNVTMQARMQSKTMRLVALLMLVLGRPSESATVSSYQGFKLCMFSNVFADVFKRCASLL